LVLVDNGSVPALDAKKLDVGGKLPLRLVAEGVAGLTAARRTGIAAARAGLLVFVDDDNFLDADYLEQAVRIARENPGVGHFGGVARAELEVPCAEWKNELLGHLGVRDHGGEVITSDKKEWGPWEPIGAGMVSRRAVAERWAEVTRTDANAAALGRSGKALLSGEDGLFAKVAYELGYQCSYQPSLKLTHYMKRNRLTVRYLARLFEGHGRSNVLLRRAMGEDPRPVTWAEMYKRLRFRIGKKGKRVGLLTFFWDLGYRAQVKEASLTSRKQGGTVVAA
jgi:glycosyltransferase involved in cell wall biosynthesis